MGAQYYICMLLIIVLAVAIEQNSGYHVSRNSFQFGNKISNNFILSAKQDFSTTEEVLENLFLKQLEDVNLFKDAVITDYFEKADDSAEFRIKDPSKAVFTYPKKIVEESVRIEPGTPIEFVNRNRIMFGNFIAWKKERPQSVELRTMSGDHINVDLGQIISSWDTLADDIPPSNVEDWAEVTTEALDLLRNMSPRKSDLQEFAQLVQQQRSSALPVDSQDLAVYIFQERRFRTWLNPYIDAADAKVSALSAAQRYAAAVLLFNDDLHFKRRPSRLSQTDSVALGGAESLMSDLYSEDIPSVDLLEGGYKILEESVAMFRECEIFAEYYAEQIQLLEQQKNGTAGDVKSAELQAAAQSGGRQRQALKPFRAGCITRQLRAIEMFALSPSSLNPPRLVKSVLKRLGQPCTPSGARQVLLGLGRQTKFSVSNLKLNRNSMNNSLYPNNNSGETSNNSSGRGSSEASAGYVLNITPWSAEVLESAAALRKEVDERRKELSAQSPGKLGKRGPSGKMDFRVGLEEHPPLCIDTKYASFYDDAFSLSPATGELLVHVVDVVNLLRRQEPLRAVCKDRISSQFLPSGPLHMLPPLVQPLLLL